MEKLSLKVFIIFLQLWSARATENKTPPHIIIILADDVGWNDVSLYGSPEIPTPNLDALAMSGILLHSHYVDRLCTPSRASLLTGKYSIRLGLQHHIIRAGEASGLPLDVNILPQYLKNLGYANHLIGKWHLGYMTKYYTPTYRGFDSFFGYWNGLLDYYNYTEKEETLLKNPPIFYGIDLHDGLNSIRNFSGSYATEVFTERAKNVIQQHDSSKPLFLVLSQIAVHTPGVFKNHQLPPIKYLNRVAHIHNDRRRVHAGIVTALDDSIGVIFKTLYDKSMLDNTILLFMSDNGGEIRQEYKGSSSNFPLRGGKESVWEGGIRVPTVIWSPLFNLHTPRISKQMMHITDWLPTLYTAAGGSPNDLQDIDGIDMWNILINDLPSPRKEILHSIDPLIGLSALRVGNLKVINGTADVEFWSKFPEHTCYNAAKSTHNCTFKDGSIVRDILTQTGKWIIQDISEWREQSAIKCPQITSDSNCKPEEKPCLFNITRDPCEVQNIADLYPKVVDSLISSIHEYQKTAVPPQTKPNDPRANPDCHNFLYVTWLDPENYVECGVHSD